MHRVNWTSSVAVVSQRSSSVVSHTHGRRRRSRRASRCRRSRKCSTARRADRTAQIAGTSSGVTALKGLERPYAVAFLPDGRMLVSERAGRIRIIANGVLDPTPVSGVPAVLNQNLRGFNDLALHPGLPPTTGSTSPTTSRIRRSRHGDRGRRAWSLRRCARAHRGERDPRGGPVGGRSVISEDPVYERRRAVLLARHSHSGQAARGHCTAHGRAESEESLRKILRITDEGKVPRDNRSWVALTIAARSRDGHSQCDGLAFHPQTGELWETENGPGRRRTEYHPPGRKLWLAGDLAWARAYTGGSGRQHRTGQRHGGEGRHGSAVFMWALSPALTGMTFHRRQVSGLEGQCVHRWTHRRVCAAYRLQPAWTSVRRYPLMAELAQRICDAAGARRTSLRAHR